MTKYQINQIRNQLMSDAKVQTLVKQNFEAKNTSTFDASFGDDGCQTRPFVLYQLFAQNNYDQLTEAQKIYLTLCYATRAADARKRDEFGLIFMIPQADRNMRIAGYKLPVSLVWRRTK